MEAAVTLRATSSPVRVGGSATQRAPARSAVPASSATGCVGTSTTRVTTGSAVARRHRRPGQATVRPARRHAGPDRRTARSTFGSVGCLAVRCVDRARPLNGTDRSRDHDRRACRSRAPAAAGRVSGGLADDAGAATTRGVSTTGGASATRRASAASTASAIATASATSMFDGGGSTVAPLGRVAVRAVAVRAVAIAVRATAVAVAVRRDRLARSPIPSVGSTGSARRAPLSEHEPRPEPDEVEPLSTSAKCREHVPPIRVGRGLTDRRWPAPWPARRRPRPPRSRRRRPRRS